MRVPDGTALACSIPRSGSAEPPLHLFTAVLHVSTHAFLLLPPLYTNLLHLYTFSSRLYTLSSLTRVYLPPLYTFHEINCV